jgi:predicted RNA-binding protein YlxR (DUF448 family)/ribosomal protein L30E
LSERTCIGCRATGSPEELVRLVLGPDGEVVADLGGGAFGRGAWVHPRPECLSAAVPRGLERSLRGKVSGTALAVAAQIRLSAQRRLLALLSSARRSKNAAVGSTAVKEAALSDAARLYIVAIDARASAETPWVERAVAAGLAVAFGTKLELGKALGGLEEVGVVAILDDGLARAIGRAHALANLPEPRPGRDVENLSTEAR